MVSYENSRKKNVCGKPQCEFKNKVRLSCFSKQSLTFIFNFLTTGFNIQTITMDDYITRMEGEINEFSLNSLKININYTAMSNTLK